MPIDVQDLTSTIEAETGPAPQEEGAAAPPDAAARELRERVRRLRRDALRTQAEGYDD